MARPVLPGLLIIGGGILCLLAGLLLLGTGGGAGPAGIGTGVAIIVVGALIPLVPKWKTAFAFTALVLAVISIAFALAGFIVGVFLILLGGMLAYVWVPPPPAPAGSSNRPNAP